MLTNTQNSTDHEPFHDWHIIDCLTQVECRQISLDTYQLRSPTHEITINKEGFDLYREDRDKFEKWVDDNKVVSVVRTDIANGD